MADPFLAEIRIFPFNFAPPGWAFCDGQLIPVSQHVALFTLLRTTYGGNGTVNFALPNLQGSAPMHHGDGPGLSPRDLGEKGGSPSVELSMNEIPSHSHGLTASANAGNSRIPGPSSALAPVPRSYAAPTGPATNLSPQALVPAGGGHPHENMQPYLTLNFCIALQGIYPSRW